MAAGTARRRTTSEARWLVANPQVLSDELRRWIRRARPKQLPPTEPHRRWVVRAGRRWGKTLVGANWCRLLVETGATDLLAIGPTYTHVASVMVKTLMDELGDDAVHRGAIDAPNIQWRGATIHLRSATAIDRCRGLGVNGVWADEVDFWKCEKMTALEAIIDVLEPLCSKPPAQFVFTSTPRRGGPVAKLCDMKGSIVTVGHTRENEANLAPGAIEAMVDAFGGSWRERQELGGEIIGDLPGAIVTRGMIEAHRVTSAPTLRRVAVGVDPSGGEAEQGIVIAGIDHRKHVYVLADRTCKLSPDGWGRRVVQSAAEFEADRIVAEANYGGAMVESTIRTVAPSCGLKLVNATRGKHVRFEPVGALYEQGRIHHVGSMPELEDEVTLFTADGYEGTDSPNRADALVWAVTELALASRGPGPAELYGRGGELVS